MPYRFLVLPRYPFVFIVFFVAITTSCYHLGVTIKGTVAYELINKKYFTNYL